MVAGTQSQSPSLHSSLLPPFSQRPGLGQPLQRRLQAPGVHVHEVPRQRRDAPHSRREAPLAASAKPSTAGAKPPAAQPAAVEDKLQRHQDPPK